MKNSTLLNLFVILICICCELNISSQSLIIEFNSPDSLSVCNHDILFLNLRNTGDKDLINADIDVILPAGIEYVKTSIINGIEKNVTQLSKPQFTINTLNAGASIQLRFLIQSDCSTNDTTFRLQNKVIIKSGNFIDSLTTSPYNLYKGLLVIFPVPNLSIELGTMGSRYINIQNTKIGSINRFVFEDRHLQSAIITSKDGTILKENNQILQLEFSGKDFVKIGNRDSLFDNGEKIIIEEFIYSEDCKPGSVDSKFYLNWGCNGFLCQDTLVRETSAVVFTSGDTKARLEFMANPKAPVCICQEKATRQELIVENTGTRNAEGIYIEIEAKKTSFGGPVNYGFTKDSIKIIGNVVVDSIVYSADDTLCSNRDLYYTIKVYVRQLNIRDKFSILFDWESCESMPPEGEFSKPWYLSYEYYSQCRQGLTGSLMEREYLIKFKNKDKVFASSSLRDQGSELKADSTYKIYTKVDYPTTLKTEKLLVYITIPSPLEITDSIFLLGMKVPVKVDIIRNSIGGTGIILTYDPPFKISDTIIVTCVKVNCNSPYVDTSLIASSLKFKTSCRIPRLIVAKYLAEICTQSQLTCPDNLGECGPKQLIPHKTKVEFDCLNEIRDSFKVKGYVDIDSKIIRENYGLEDKNNDRFADSKNKADTSLIRLDRIITGDTILTEIDAKIRVDIPGSSFDSIIMLMTNNFFYDAYGIELDWFDISESKIYKFKISQLDTFDSERVDLSCSVARLFGLDLGDGYALNITPEYLNSLNSQYPKNNRFEEGDSMHLRFSSVVASIVGTRIYDANIRHRIILRDRRDPADRNFYCGEKNHKLELVTNCIVLNSSGKSVNMCGNYFELPFQSILIRPHLKNFFPFEFRSYSKLDSLILFGIPNGLVADSIEINIYFNDSTTKTLIRKMTLPVVPLGNNWTISKDSMSKLKFDEAYQIDYKVFGSVTDCKKLNASGRYQVSTNAFYSSEPTVPFHFDESFLEVFNSKIFTDVLEIIQGNLNDSLGLINRSIDTSSKLFDIDANIRNLSHSGSFKFKLSSKKGMINNFNVSILPFAPVQKISNSEFIVGLLPEGGSYKILFSGENSSCDGDTLCIESIWACNASKIDSTNDCVVKNYQIPIIFKRTILELDHFPKESKELRLCDTLPEIELYLYNAELGPAFDLYVDIFIPEGVAIVPGSTFLAYPSNAAFQSTQLPQKISNTQYRFYISNLLPQIKMNGLPGVGESGTMRNGLRIRFKLLTSCNSSINGYLNFLGKGKDLCNKDIYTANRIGNQIKVKGISNGASYELSSKLNSSNICVPDASLSVSLKGSGIIQLGDSIRIFLPSPMEFVPGSFQAIQNINNQVPVILNTTGGKFLTVLLREGVSLDKDILFEIRVTNLTEIPCGLFNIPLELFNRQRTLCVTTQQECDVKVSKAQYNITFDKRSIEIIIDSFRMSENSGIGNYTNTIYLNNSNISYKTDSTICFNLLEDSNLNGTLDANDKLIKEFCFPSNRFTNDGSFILTDILDEKQILNCQLILTTSLKNCMCSQDTAYFQLNQLIRKRIVDPKQYCSSTTLTIGIDSNNIAKYNWTKGFVACDTCSKNKIIIPDTLAGVREFIYELTETLPGACNRVYEFVIRAVPEVMGRKTITEICFGDSVSINSGDRRNIRWTGPGIKNRDATLQIIKGDSNKVYYLDFIDQANCPGIDTFCIVIKTSSEVINIIADSDTISLGDSVRINVMGGVKWKWINPKDLDCDTCQSVIATPKISSAYSVEVTDSLGCKHVFDISIIVFVVPCDSSNIFIPNAFSPNGDTKNDVFRVRSINITSIYLIVYNRWGEKVFESNDINMGWDGTFKGDKLPPDVFGYYLEAVCPGDKRFVKKGNVSLLK